MVAKSLSLHSHKKNKKWLPLERSTDNNENSWGLFKGIHELTCQYSSQIYLFFSSNSSDFKRKPTDSGLTVLHREKHLSLILVMGLLTLAEI